MSFRVYKIYQNISLPIQKWNQLSMIENEMQ